MYINLGTLSQILAMDINRENYDLGRPIIEKAGVAHKIDFREGPALPVLDQLVEDVSFCAVLHVMLSDVTHSDSQSNM